jgi:hypothetical protein
VIVYVETNFLFELATGRDKKDSCGLLLEWARQQQIHLRLPATALTEMRTALRRRAAIQLGVARDLGDQFRDVQRGRDDEIARTYKAAETYLKATVKTEGNHLSVLTEELSRIAAIIPLDGDVLALSERFRALEVLTGDGDLLNFASIMRDLELQKFNGETAPSMFITGDADFGNVRKHIRPYSCDLLTSYSAAVARLKGSSP